MILSFGDVMNEVFTGASYKLELLLFIKSPRGHSTDRTESNYCERISSLLLFLSDCKFLRINFAKFPDYLNYTEVLLRGVEALTPRLDRVESS